jgi:transposase
MDDMMSQKEVKQAQVMELLTASKINQKEAGKRLAVSVRQIKRIVQHYLVTGLSGLISKKRCQPANRRLDEEAKRLSIELIGQTRKGGA